MQEPATNADEVVGLGEIFLLCSVGALVGTGDNPAWWCGFLWEAGPRIWTMLRAKCVLYVILGDIGSLTALMLDSKQETAHQLILNL